MKRWQILLMAVGALLLIGWGLRETGWFGADSEGVMPRRPIHVPSIETMDTPSGWRYRQNRPHHWRYIMLQKY